MPDEVKQNIIFIGEKVSKIRWVAEQYDESNHFVTGNHNSIGKNSVKVWKLFRNEYSDDENEYSPKCTAELKFGGDITGLEFLDAENIISSSNTGDVNIIHLNKERERENLKKKFCYTKLHKEACTDLSIYDGDVATVGEDGILNILSVHSQKIIKSFTPESCPIISTAFINRKEILTGNRLGVIKCYDLRLDKESASLILSAMDERQLNAVMCMTYHPTQRHIVLGGSEEGSITVWDLRHTKFPASYISAHEHAINEIAFHQTQPTKLYTASEGGELWQWTQNSLMISNDYENPNMIQEVDTSNPWLDGDLVKNKITVSALVSDVGKSVNTFDSSRSKVICGSDIEAIFLMENMY